MNFELKKSLSTLELSDLVRIIEMQEKDIKLVDMSYDERLELLLSTLVQERENKEDTKGIGAVLKMLVKNDQLM